MHKSLEAFDNLIKDFRHQIMRGKESFNWREINQILNAYAEMRAYAVECEKDADLLSKKLLEAGKRGEKEAEPREYDTLAHGHRWSPGVAMD